uniref:Borealin n=1 Tax=Naja naja TaxID=35670 RepID=A0A8C6XX40_NAJNA
MAPGRKRATTRGAAKASARDKRVDAFLKDFDREVRARVAQVRAEGESLKKDVENLSNMELLRLPLAVRDMNWIEFLGKSRPSPRWTPTPEVDIVEITQLASRAIQTPFRIAKKGQPGLGWGWGGWRRGRRAHLMLSRCPPVKPSTGLLNQRVSGAALRQGWLVGHPPDLACFCPPPPSVFRTPGLRAPAAHEQVFSISVNGSPLADSSEVFLTVPLGRGEVRGTGKGGSVGAISAQVGVVGTSGAPPWPGREAVRPLHELGGWG